MLSHIRLYVALNTRTALALPSFPINQINSIVRKQCLLDYPFIFRSSMLIPLQMIVCYDLRINFSFPPLNSE